MLGALLLAFLTATQELTLKQLVYASAVTGAESYDEVPLLSPCLMSSPYSACIIFNIFAGYAPPTSEKESFFHLIVGHFTLCAAACGCLFRTSRLHDLYSVRDITPVRLPGASFAFKPIMALSPALYGSFMLHVM